MIMDVDGLPKRFDDCPAEIEYTGQECEHLLQDEPCRKPATSSIWADFGVHRHSWTEWALRCSDHVNEFPISYYHRIVSVVANEGRRSQN